MIQKFPAKTSVPVQALGLSSVTIKLKFTRLVDLYEFKI